MDQVRNLAKFFSVCAVTLGFVTSIAVSKAKADGLTPTPFEQTMIQRAVAKGFSFNWEARPEEMLPRQIWGTTVSKLVRLYDIKFKGKGINMGIPVPRSSRADQIAQLCSQIFVDGRDSRYKVAVGEKLNYRTLDQKDSPLSLELGEVVCELLVDRPTDTEVASK